IRFGKGEGFIRKDKGEIHLPANYAPGKIPEYHGELLLWLANGRTNLACTLKDRTNFGRRVASGRDVCRPPWVYELQFRLVAPSVAWNLLQQFSGGFQILYSLGRSAPRQGLCCSPSQVFDGFFAIAASREVMGQIGQVVIECITIE